MALLAAPHIAAPHTAESGTGADDGGATASGDSAEARADGPQVPVPDLGWTDLRDLLPAVSLVVHVYAGPREASAEGEELDRIARVEGHGPVSETWLREVLGRYARFDVRPVLHPEGLAPVEAYEVPARHRRAVQLLAPT